MKVLIGCEFSGIVREAFRKKGHDSWSCDFLPTERHPIAKHYRGDIIDILDDRWDLMICHPPCTYLAVAANRSFLNNPARWEKRLDAMKFVWRLLNAPINKIALENPISVISSHIRKPDQIIQPYQFGDKAVKKTCLWLKNLPCLTPTKMVEPEYVIYNSSTKKSGKSKYPLQWKNKKDWKERSRTYQGIANAMAEQWG